MLFISKELTNIATLGGAQTLTDQKTTTKDFFCINNAIISIDRIQSQKQDERKIQNELDRTLTPEGNRNSRPQERRKRR